MVFESLGFAVLVFGAVVVAWLLGYEAGRRR